MDTLVTTDWLSQHLGQLITCFLPSRHYISFAQAVVFRGAGFEIFLPQFLTIASLGLVFFTASLAQIRRAIMVSK